MSKRDEIIEAAGAAIERAWNSDDNCVEGLPPIDLSESERRLLATAALDSALLAMSNPDDAMCEAGGKAFIWPSEGHGGKTPGQSAVAGMTAMLTTLQAKP